MPSLKTLTPGHVCGRQNKIYCRIKLDRALYELGRFEVLCCDNRMENAVFSTSLAHVSSETKTIVRNSVQQIIQWRS